MHQLPHGYMGLDLVSCGGMPKTPLLFVVSICLAMVFPDNVYLTDSLQLSRYGKKTLSAYSSNVFSVKGFSTAPPSPGNARGLIWFPALAFHEVTAKEDTLGSHDGRIHLVTDKQCTT